MKMPQRSSKSLRDFTRGEAHSSARFLWAADATVALGDLARSSSLDRAATELAGRSVLLALPDQLTTALAMIELDGIARRLALCPPDLPPEQLFQVIAIAQADAVVCGRSGPPPAAGDIALRVGCGPAITGSPSSGARSTISAATADCRSSCARCSAARHWCSRAPASRWPPISSG